jgi:RsiW-degrading membrane proteinase PrsW (M82 family)
MPNWVKHALWLFILLLLLARWRQVAEFISGIAGSLREACCNSSSSPTACFMSFLVFGILVVMATVLWAIYCRNRPEKKP